MKIVLSKGQILGPISGADEILVSYAIQLHRVGHTVSVLLMYRHSTQDQYYTRLVDAGVPVFYIGSNLSQASLGFSRRVLRRLFQKFPISEKFIRRGSQPVITHLATNYYSQCLKRLEQLKADVLHVITPDPSAMVMIRAAHAAGIPVIYQEAGIPFHPPNFERYYQQFTSVLPFCSEIAALSPRLAEYCQEELPGMKPLTVLPLMYDEVHNGNGDARKARNAVTFGFAARIEKLKGPMILMEAFGKAHAECPDIHLIVAGAGSQRDLLARRARSMRVAESYDYYGVYTKLSERTAFMRGLDVFVMPSFTEGTPNSIIEAMANGLPIIASEVGGIPDMIDSASGILVPPGDADALSRAIVKLAKDESLRIRMGIAARERYQKLFSPEAVLPVVVETYQRIAGHKGEPPSVKTNGNRHPWILDPNHNNG
jgi:glycosyltransferase involved in cell wall biosynthesis